MALSVLLTAQLTVAVVGPASPLSPISPAGAQTSSGGSGCVDELELRVPWRDAAVLGSVYLPQNHRLRVTVEHSLGERDGYDDWSGELRLSERSLNGFPADQVSRDSYYVSNSWPTSRTKTETMWVTNTTTNPHKVLELDYLINRLELFQGARSVARNFTIVNPAGGSSPACVIAGNVPDRPAGCPNMPVIAVADNGEVRSESFTLPIGKWVRPNLLHEKVLPTQDDGTFATFGVHRWDWNTKFALVEEGKAVDWSGASSEIYLSGNNSEYGWSREAYLERGPWLKNTSRRSRVQLVMRIDYAPSSLRNGWPPAFTTIESAWIDGTTGCINSTETSVNWPARPHCAADNTSAITVVVANKDTSAKSYRLVITDPNDGRVIHGSHDQSVAGEGLGKVTLGGIPDGEWIVTVHQGDTALKPPRRYVVSRFQSCIAEGDEPLVWASEPSCAYDNTREITAEVRNQGMVRLNYRIEVREPGSSTAIHASHDHWIDPGGHYTLRLGGMPAGAWDVVVTESGGQIGPTATYYFGPYDCSEAPPCPPDGPIVDDLHRVYCALDPDQPMSIGRIEAAIDVVNDHVGTEILSRSGLAVLGTNTNIDELVNALTAEQTAAIDEIAGVVGAERMGRFVNLAERELRVESVSMYRFWELMVPLAYIHGSAELHKVPDFEWNPQIQSVVSVSFDLLGDGTDVVNAVVYRGTSSGARLSAGLFSRVSYAAGAAGVIRSVVEGDTDNTSFQYSVAGLGFGTAALFVTGPVGVILGGLGTVFGIFSIFPQCSYPNLDDSVNRHIGYKRYQDGDSSSCFDARDDVGIWLESVARTETRIMQRMIAAGCAEQWGSGYRAAGITCADGSFDDRSTNNPASIEWWFCEEDKFSEWTYAIGVARNNSDYSMSLGYGGLRPFLNNDIRSVRVDQEWGAQANEKYASTVAVSFVPSCP